MKHLTTILDRVANELETRGLKKLAAEVDVVANTLEKTAARDFGISPIKNIVGPIGKTEEEYNKSLEEVKKQGHQKGAHTWFETSGCKESEEHVLQYLAWYDLQKPVDEKMWEFLHSFLFSTSRKPEGKKDILKKLMGSDKYKPAQLDQEIGKLTEKAKEEDSSLSQEEVGILESYKVLHKFSDGWMWTIPTDGQGNEKGGCPILGKTQGHCGNGSGMDGDTMFVLRKKALGFVPVVGATVIVNNGKVRESKGAFNKKIDLDKHGEHMLWLFEHERVKGLDDRGAYMSDANTHMSDLISNEKQGEAAKELAQKKPSLMDNAHDKFVSEWGPWYAGQPDKRVALEMLKSMYPKKAKISQIRAVTGLKDVFSEQELAGMAGKVGILDLMADAGSKVLTPAVQESFSKVPKDLSDMIHMAATGVKEIQVGKLAGWIGAFNFFTLNGYNGAVGMKIKEKLEKFLLTEPKVQEALLEKDPDAIRHVKEYLDKLPASAWESFGKGLEEDPGVMLYVKEYLDKLPASVWESFGKGLEKYPRVIRHVTDYFDKLPASAWESFGKGLEEDPGAIQYVTDEVLKDLLIKGDTDGVMRHLHPQEKLASTVRRLDKIASILESRGLIKLAMQVDVVSNTLNK